MSKDDTEIEEGFVERRKSIIERRVGMDRRRGPGIRRSPERIAAEEGHMTDEQFDFLLTIDRYKRENKKPFPTWTEVLDVIKAMGYRKVAEPQSIDTFKEETQLQPTG